MCGRFTLNATPEQIAETFGLSIRPEWSPRYNIAPTQLIPIVRVTTANAAREWQMVHWGLLPSWSRDRTRAASLINARSETVAEKPSFREAFRHRRCLIPASGFYEWETIDKKTKQPYLIARGEQSLFAFAGLWERWISPEQEVVETCTILTTAADEAIKHLHERMPIIMEPEHYEEWLDPQLESMARAEELLRPTQPAEWKWRQVSTAVNNARTEGPICLEPPRDQLFQ
ncbi:MAG: SOS response-associated peptidase [Planctomycetota bacterium]|nr:SOS response-associated peptidase [Planctomycetota bacterium]MDA1211371.1 SOS response-associated peptidase [Planctomycetota bacterium]